MIGRINFAKSNDTLYYSINNCVFADNNIILETDYRIIQIKIFGSFLICYGSFNLMIYNLETKAIEKFTFTEYLGDVYYKNNELVVATLNGSIYKNVKFDLDIKSIQAIKCDDKIIVAGNYNYVHIYYQNKIYKYEMHKGRVFDVVINQYGFMSVGEDRKIMVIDSNGSWYTQETRNYAIRCGIYKCFVWYINKNGDYKLFRNRELIYHKKTDILCI